MDDDDFNPNDKQYDAEGGGKFIDLKTPGTYLLGLRSVFEHATNRNDKRFSRISFVVLDGKHKGESFLDRIYRNKEALKRLAHICRSARVTETFKPSKDADIERVLIGRAIKSSVRVNENGYAELKFPEETWTEHELEVMTDWERTFKKSGGGKRRRRPPTDPVNQGDLPPLDDFADDFGSDFGSDIPF